MRNMMVTVASRGLHHGRAGQGPLGAPGDARATRPATRCCRSVSGFALSLGFIVGGTLLVEIVFSYPGIGFLLFQAVGAKDYPLMQGIFLVITLVGAGRQPRSPTSPTCCSTRAPARRADR